VFSLEKALKGFLEIEVNSSFCRILQSIRHFILIGGLLMYILKRFTQFMIMVFLINVLLIFTSVKADSTITDTKKGWVGIGAFGAAIKEDGTVWA
jgi:hypothetical protein